MKYLDYIDEWLKYKESEYSFSTLKTYKGLLNKHFRPFFKDRQIEDLTRLELQNFVNTLTTSQKVCIAILKKTLKELYYDELTPKDFSSQLRRPPKAHITKPKQALTREQVDRLFDYLKDNRWYYFIRLLFTSGLRIGEALALQWSDVLWYTKVNTTVHPKDTDRITYVVLKINKTYDEHEGINHEPKTSSSKREVIVTDPTTIELLANKWSVVGYQENSYVAQSRRCSNQPVSRVAIKNIFKKATEALDLPFVLTPHHARLNYTSHSLANGISEKNLQTQLGHSSTNLIRTVYGKAIGNRLEELIERPNVYYFR